MYLNNVSFHLSIKAEIRLCFINTIENSLKFFFIDADSIPEYYDYFPKTAKNKPILVMELLGFDLHKIWRKIGPFSTITTMTIGIKMVRKTVCRISLADI